MKKTLLGLGLVVSGLLFLSKWFADNGPVCSKHIISKTLHNGKLRCAKCARGE